MLLAIVVAVLVMFCVGALVLFVAGPSPRDTSRVAAYLLVGAASVLMLTFVVTYITLWILQRRRGGIDGNLGQGL